MSYRPRIIVVDDEVRMCESVKILLEDKDYDIETFLNGRDALSFLEENECELVLLDLMMPVMDGFQVMTCLKQRYPDIAIIIMTGSGSIDSAVGALKAGAYDYLCKPFEHDELIKRVENVLNQKRLLRERKIISEQLASAEARYRYLVQNSPDIIYTLDVDGRFVFVNNAIESVTGVDSDHLIGKPFTSIVHDDDAGIVDAHMQDIRAVKATPALLEFKLKCAECVIGRGVCSGAHPAIEMKAVSLANVVWRGANGEVSGIYGIIRDITKRKQAEEEKKSLESQFRQAQKMEAIGTLAGGIAHDFNNLLMAIQGNISLMLYHTDSSNPSHSRLKKVEKLIESGSKLTSQLLGYARKGKYEAKPIELNRVVVETVNTFSRMKKEICFHYDLDDDLPPVDADSNQMEQVLMNLFLNSADAMPGGGDITIHTRKINHMSIKGMLYDPKPGYYILLSVEDTGTGMDEKTKERIFEPFFTTKEMGRGTGLGLASVYGIVKGHLGFIDVESALGVGTTFNIYFPASDSAAQEVTGEGVDAVLKGDETVLLVDDEEDVLEISKAMVEALGYKTIMSRGGPEAVKLYHERKDHIDLVLLDMIMPGMNGGKIYDHLKEINPSVKVILVSGYSINGNAKEILSRGCNGFIQKPFRIKELSMKIRDILGK